MNTPRPGQSGLQCGWCKTAASLISVVCFFVGCQTHALTQSTQATKPYAPSEIKTQSVLLDEQAADFELYSTLAGKMARMEELLGGIERFLDQPGFKKRLASDAEEFHQLLSECRGLYPEELLPQDQAGFDEAVNQTLATSSKLMSSIHANDIEAAEHAIQKLFQQRRKAHARFSQ